MMQPQIKAAQAAAQAELCPNLADRPVDMHQIYMRNADCGYTKDLLLTAHETREIASRLRGISAITGVLIACADEDEIKLSQFLRSGLYGALNALADDAAGYMEQASIRQEPQGGRNGL